MSMAKPQKAFSFPTSIGHGSSAKFWSVFCQKYYTPQETLDSETKIRPKNLTSKVSRVSSVREEIIPLVHWSVLHQDVSSEGGNYLARSQSLTGWRVFRRGWLVI